MLKKVVSMALIFSMTLALAVTAVPLQDADAATKPSIKGQKTIMVGGKTKLSVKGKKKSTYKWVC